MKLQNITAAAAWPFRLELLNRDAEKLAHTDCAGFSARVYAETEIIKIWPISDGVAVMLDTDENGRGDE